MKFFRNRGKSGKRGKGYDISYYCADAAIAIAEGRRAFSGNIETETVVIGGGLAGLSVALSLAERGRHVVVLEKNRIGWGASGRNGGMVSIGFSAFYDAIIRKVGMAHTQRLYGLANEGMTRIRSCIRDYKIDCPVVDGVLETSWYEDPVEMKGYVDILNRHCGTRAEYWSPEKVRKHYETECYHDAAFIPEGFHINPLQYLHGVANAVELKGGRIHEGTDVIEIVRGSGGGNFAVRTPCGNISARRVVVACGAYVESGLNEDIAASNIPIRGYMMVTEPLPKGLMENTIRAPYAVYDNRHVPSYFRPLADGRILWGGKGGFFRDPVDIEAMLTDDMLSIFPQLEGVRAEKAWAGSYGMATHAMPQIGELEPGLWYSAGHGCHGLATTAMAGELIARALTENDIAWRAFNPYGLTSTGGTLGKIGAMLVYNSFMVRDRLAV